MSRIKDFIRIYKKILYDNRNNIHIKSDDIKVILVGFEKLNASDKEFITTIMLGEIKIMLDKPLSGEQLARLKYFNSKELIHLKVWVAKVALITLIVVATLAISLSLVHKLPDINKDLVTLSTDIMKNHVEIKDLKTDISDQK